MPKIAVHFSWRLGAEDISELNISFDNSKRVSDYVGLFVRSLFLLAINTFCLLRLKEINEYGLDYLFYILALIYMFTLYAIVWIRMIITTYDVISYALTKIFSDKGGISGSIRSVSALFLIVALVSASHAAIGQVMIEMVLARGGL